MPQDQVQEIKEKTDIVGIIGERVALKKAGRNWRGLCPFHSEKTPSFMVSPELQIYKCFGCSESGDVYSFLEKYEGMDFFEALKYLAGRVGVKLVLTNTGERSEKDRFYQINALVKNFYHYLLTSHPSGKKAYDYLTRERGLKRDTLEKFELGFAPAASNILSDLLTKKKKIARNELINVGLFYPRGGDLVDRFAGRVIFPLFDHRGNTVGFAGRVLPGQDFGDAGKYINSPETAIYHKSKVLYGLNFTKSDIKRAGRVIVVEGELDLISSWQAGIKNVVAIKGTAITPDQLELLSRFASEVVLCLDADSAGDAAARRGIANAYNRGLSIKVVRLKGFKDPDEAARGNPQAFEMAIGKAIPVWDYYLDSALAKYDTKTGEGKRQIAKEVVPVLSSIEDKIMQAHYIKLLSVRLDVPEDAVNEEIGKAKGILSVSAGKKEEVENEEKSRRELLEEKLLSLLFLGRPEELVKPEIKKYLTSRVLLKIVDEYCRLRPENITDLARQLPKELFDTFSGLILAGEESGESEIDLVKKEIETLTIREKLARLTAEIREVEKGKDKSRLTQLEEEFAAASKMLAGGV